jgi:hypothetical protein
MEALCNDLPWYKTASLRRSALSTTMTNLKYLRRTSNGKCRLKRHSTGNLPGETLILHDNRHCGVNLYVPRSPRPPRLRPQLPWQTPSGYDVHCFGFDDIASALSTTTATAVRCVDDDNNVPLLRRNGRFATASQPCLRPHASTRVQGQTRLTTHVTFNDSVGLGCDSLCSMA